MKVLVFFVILFGFILGGLWGGFWATIIVLAVYSLRKPTPKEESTVSKHTPTRSVSASRGTARSPSGYASADTRQSSKVGLKWIPSGQSFKISSYQLDTGLVYTSNGHPGVFEPSAINTRLPIAKPSADTGIPLPYFPSYEALSPSQRGSYLQWLSNGRTDAAPENREFGYLFIFFYGLERRVMVDGDFSEQIAQAVADLIETYSKYGRSKSLPSYFSQLLHFWGHHQGTDRYAEIWPWIIDISNTVLDRDELHLVLHNLASRGLSAPAKVAKEIAYHEPTATRSSVPSRSPAEFETIFNARFQVQFPQGVPLTLGQRTVVTRYLAASAALRQGEFLDSGRFVVRTTYVSIKTADRQKLIELWNECCAELSGYVRAQARAKLVGKAINLPALLSTPPELRSRYTKGMKERFEDVLSGAVLDDDFHFIATDAIGSFFGLEIRPKYTLTQSKQLSEGLEALGWMMEPDPRIHGSALSLSQEIVLFKAQTTPSSADFLGRCAFIQMAMTVAMSDGGIDLRENETVSQIIDSTDIPASDRIRLRAWAGLLERNLNNAPATIIKVAKAVPVTSSQAIAQLLCKVATADGVVTKNEERMLERIFRALGLSAAIIATLKKELEGFDESTVSIAASNSARSAERIPRPESKKPDAFVLDRSRIHSLSKETAEVMGILSVAMADAEHEEQTIEEPQQTAANTTATTTMLEPTETWMETLDSKFIPLLKKVIERDSWSKKDFDAIASELHLMPGGAFDAINEWSDDALGDFLLLDEDPISVNLELIDLENATSR